MSSRPAYRTLSMLAALSLVAAGCGPDKQRNSRAAGSLRRTLRVAIGDPASLDPTHASNRWAALVSKQICDTLVAFDPQTASLQPAIASSWVIAPDARTVTFKLRPGVKFHDGTVVSADDYVASLSRFVHPGEGSSEHALLKWVEGYRQVRDGGADVLPGVRAPDALTLEIRLSEPYAELPAVLANPAVGAAVAEQGADPSSAGRDWNPVCSGPYRLRRPWAKGQDIALVRFRDYYAGNRAFERGGRGSAEFIELEVTRDDPSGFALFERGVVDVAPVPVNRLGEAGSVAHRVSSAPSGYISYVGFPYDRSPYDNPELRKALALSVERKPLLKKLGLGSRAAPTGFLPAAAGPVARQDDCPGVLEMEPDLAAARKALADSGWDSKNQNLTVYMNSGGGHERWLEPLVRQWRTGLGVNAALHSAAWPQYLDRLVSAGPEGPFRLAWAVRFPSPDSVLQPLLESNSPDNLTEFSNPTFDDLLRRARMTADDQPRHSLYSEAAGLLCSELPYLPIWYGENHYAFGPHWLNQGGRPLDRMDVFGDPILRELSAG